MKKFLLLGICAIFLVSMFATQAYAQSDDFRYALLFITTWKDCSDRNWDTMWYYESVTRQYLKMNGIIGTGSINCESLDEYQTKLQLGAYENYDLVIMIPDFWYSNKYIQSTKWLGQHTYYADRPDIIISNSFSIWNENKQSTWTLSHELMHFVIAYKNYGWNYHEDYVHKVDAYYDNGCKNYIERCPSIYSTIRASSGNYIPVLKPMAEPYKPNQKQTTYISSSVNGKTMTTITNGEDPLCFGAKLYSYNGIPVSYAKLDVYSKIAIGDREPYTYVSSGITDAYGYYVDCKRPFKFGVMDDIMINIVAIYDGNDEFKSGKGSMLTVFVDTPWKKQSTNLNLE